MSNPTSLHKPYLVGPAFTGYELTIATDNATPTAGTLSVYNVRMNPLSGVRAVVNRFGPKKVRVEAVFTGTDAANADTLIHLWTWNAVTEQWHAPNAGVAAGVVPVVGSATKGTQFDVDTNPLHRQGYIQVVNLQVNQAAVVTVTKVE